MIEIEKTRKPKPDLTITRQWEGIEWFIEFYCKRTIVVKWGVTGEVNHREVFAGKYNTPTGIKAITAFVKELAKKEMED
jgi:hypothetical protein